MGAVGCINQLPGNAEARFRAAYAPFEHMRDAQRCDRQPDGHPGDGRCDGRSPGTAQSRPAGSGAGAQNIATEIAARDKARLTPFAGRAAPYLVRARVSFFDSLGRGPARRAEVGRKERQTMTSLSKLPILGLLLAGCA